MGHLVRGLQDFSKKCRFNDIQNRLQNTQKSSF